MLSDYCYGGAVCELHLLLPVMYLFDIFVTIIAHNYVLCGQSFNNVKYDSFAATVDIHKQVYDTADVDLPFVCVRNLISDLY